MSQVCSPLIPLWVKISYSTFLVVMVPIYLRQYGPTNFLYFCDVAAFLTLGALWTENALLASIAAVGIVLPQLGWLLDFATHLVGLKITGLSDYMFNAKISWFTRAISLFHGWLPILLLYMLRRLGYDQRGFWIWLCIAWALMLICYFWIPKPGSLSPGSTQPSNINYVYGFNSQAPQHWMPAWAWFWFLMLGEPLLMWWPTHIVFSRVFARGHL